MTSDTRNTHAIGRTRRAKMRKAATTEIAFHSDGVGREAHAAVNVRVYSVPGVNADDATREQAWDEAVRIFWGSAMFVAHKYGYSGVFSEGRSSGWCVPFRQRKNGELYHFASWPGQGPAWGYPEYPDMNDPKERARFVRFRKAILALVEQCKQHYVTLVKAT